MGQADRPRAEREQQRPTSTSPGATPIVNQMTSMTWVSPANTEEIARQRQNFLAGTVYAASAGHLFLTGNHDTPPPAPVFFVALDENATTSGPAPQLREALDLVDQYGSTTVLNMLAIATGWAAIDGADPLAKLKLTFTPPITPGNVHIVLEAENYRLSWRHIVGGGLVAITTTERLRRASSAGPNGSFTDAIDTALLVRIGASPVIRHLMTNHHW